MISPNFSRHQFLLFFLNSDMQKICKNLFLSNSRLVNLFSLSFFGPALLFFLFCFRPLLKWIHQAKRREAPDRTGSFQARWYRSWVALGIEVAERVGVERGTKAANFIFFFFHTLYSLIISPPSLFQFVGVYMYSTRKGIFPDADRIPELNTDRLIIWKRKEVSAISGM